jgi:hypothetical protein
MGASAAQNASQVVAKAERCRCEARAKVESNSLLYSELLSQPSGWCVVTEAYTWLRRYHTMNRRRPAMRKNPTRSQSRPHGGFGS